MPRYRVEVVFVCRHWSEVVVEAENPDVAADLARDLAGFVEVHEDNDPDVETNVFPLPDRE